MTQDHAHHGAPGEWMHGIVDQLWTTTATAIHFYLPETHAYQISASFDLFPQHCTLPDLHAEQHAKVICDELINSIQALPTNIKIFPRCVKPLKTWPITNPSYQQRHQVNSKEE